MTMPAPVPRRNGCADLIGNTWAVFRNAYRNNPAFNAVVNTGLAYGIPKAAGAIATYFTHDPSYQMLGDTLAPTFAVGYSYVRAGEIPNQHLRNVLRVGIFGLGGYDLANSLDHYHGQGAFYDSLKDGLEWVDTNIADYVRKGVHNATNINLPNDPAFTGGLVGALTPPTVNLAYKFLRSLGTARTATTN